jgi:hypothetical protein
MGQTGCERLPLLHAEAIRSLRLSNHGLAPRQRKEGNSGEDFQVCQPEAYQVARHTILSRIFTVNQLIYHLADNVLLEILKQAFDIAEVR